MLWSCREVTRSTSDFLDGNLHVSKRVALRLHLSMCRGCRIYLEQIRLTVTALAALPRPAPDPAVRAALTQQFRESVRRPAS